MNLDTPATVLLGILLVVLSGFGVAIVARHQHVSLWVATPVILWPSGNVYVQAPIIGILALGTLIGSRSRLRETRKPILLFLGFAIVMTLGLIFHGVPMTVTPDEQRNSFIAMLLSVSVIPIVALQRTPLLTTLKVVALSSALISVYILITYQVVGGRVSSETHNSDAIGLAAALGILTSIGALILTRKFRWFLVSIPSIALFVEAQTRAALVILGVGLLLLWLFHNASPTRIAIAILVLAAAPFLPDLVLAMERALFSQRDTQYLEVQSRVDVLLLAGRLIVENPISGIGWRHFTDESLQTIGVVINAHNDYALIGAEGGMVALALLAGLVLRSVTFRDPTAGGHVLRALAIAAAAALLFGNLITDLRVTWVIWILLGIAWSSQRSKTAHPSAFDRGRRASSILQR